ncbi:putative chitinase [Herbaspirillum sp. Sphag1AN]|uniref:hydroxyethylthiazole kinase n=1 Tax=unclassified Herbaspirillum TaxID=2624150 RepID=UPI00161A8C8D|nr:MULTISPECIES: hydroxyethylthiazole kinase [unclassified Herbaspirillum]MBB3213700.1 putative chitinase [Herbaspirillum sp. Sphag1AN]MBB3246897.1 putative chitinase [Herbaspirillum sp. Sphag64]
MNLHVPSSFIRSTTSMHAVTKQLHFEICCDTENLKKIIGREPGWLDPEAIPTKDGRTDSIFGSLYIYLPATTPISLKAPTDHLRAETDITLGTAQWIKLDYGNEGKTPGSCAFTSYGINGQLGATRQDADAEYNLYKEATDRHNSLIKAHPAVKSSPSGWYELLRFGRNIGRSETDKDPLPDNAAHWRKIRTLEDKSVWADLNAPGTYKFSDADFLPQFGWNCYDDDTSPNDQRCDSKRLKALIRAEGDQPNPDRNKDDVELSRRLPEKDVRKALRRTICKFPTEWDRGTIIARYGCLNEMEFGAKNRADRWARFENHARAVSFDGLPQEYKDAQWHFHPTEFIKHFRKCGWMDEETLEKIYKQTPVPIREKYRFSLNIVMRKYMINTAERQAHFLGQGAIESYYLMNMMEGTVSFHKNPSHPSYVVEINKYYSDPKDMYVNFHNYEKDGNNLGNIEKSDLRDRNNNKLFIEIKKDQKNRLYLYALTREMIDPQYSKSGDGMKFRGRGFKQLTGRYNYAKYWVYRGWISLSNFDSVWWGEKIGHRAPIIDNPQIISNVPYNCIDSGGHFFAKNKCIKSADGGVNIKSSNSISLVINKFDTQSFDRRFFEVKNSYIYVGDEI